MDMEYSEPRFSVERDQDVLEDNGMERTRESSKHHNKDRKRSSRREEKDHKSKDRERTKTSDVLKEAKDLEKDQVPSREKRKEDVDEHKRSRNRDKSKERDYDRDKFKEREDRVKGKDRERDKDRGKERDHERERDTEKVSDRGRDKERGKEKNRDRDKERDKEKDRPKEREWEKERDKHKDREKERENDKDRDRDVFEREKGKEKIRDRDREREADHDKERSRDRDKLNRKSRDEGHSKSKDGGKNDKSRLDSEDQRDRDVIKRGKGSHHDENGSRTSEQEQNDEATPGGPHLSASKLEERILKMKEERLKNKSEGVSEVLSWVSRSRKIEEKRNAEKEKALQLSKMFEEQDNINQGESEDEEAPRHTAQHLAGVKVLHGLDKVVEGGAIVLTLKDQSILAGGDINEEVDMLENVEIGEQKRRDDAYIAAKKKTGIYEDKFNDEPGSDKRILPKYDDPVKDEGVTLDERGRFTGEAEKKLEELRKRIQGASTINNFENLNSVGTISSDYYTTEEMLQFKKPKKKKSLRKREKLDLDALEAEAKSAGLGSGELGSRIDGRRQAIRQEQERLEAQMKNDAYQSALAKADEASKALQSDQTLNVKSEEDENLVDGDDEDLYKSLEKTRKLALKLQNEKASSGPQAIALLATSTLINQSSDDQNPSSGEPREGKVVFTEMEDFVRGLQLDEETHKPDDEDVFMEEDEAPKASDEEINNEAGGWTEVNDTNEDEHPVNEDKDEMAPDETIHETPVGRGLSGALQLLKERGTLKESIDWGGRNMDKKKSKLVGLNDNDAAKEIRIERLDEFGRIMTPKEAFRLISHKFHGKGPGKMKQEKRMKQFHDELKLKKMKNSDTPSLSVERMRETQARLKTPYLVLSGHVKPGQTSDPRSGFATVEKDFPGGLTPMLGDRKVEHFLGIKRKDKDEPGDMGPPKKPRT